MAKNKLDNKITLKLSIREISLIISCLNSVRSFCYSNTELRIRKIIQAFENHLNKYLNKR